MLFIRGDRLANNATAKSPSTLRATGILNQAATTITVPGSRPYTLVGNPYAAALNFENIYNSSISNLFTVWNSSQGDYGAYNTVIRNGANDYSVIPFGTQTSTPANGAQFIESGSGFFVRPPQPQMAALPLTNLPRVHRQSMGWEPSGKCRLLTGNFG